MRFTILILVYSHIFMFANPALSTGSENTSTRLPDVAGEMKKFSFHTDPTLVKSLLVLNDQEIEIDLMKQEYDFILVNFWATWCAPCVEEMPSLSKLQSLFNIDELKIITIATGRNNQNKIAEFFSNHVILNLENFRDPKGTLATKLGIFGLPSTILISPRGYEIARLMGPINWMQPSVIKFFKALSM